MSRLPRSSIPVLAALSASVAVGAASELRGQALVGSVVDAADGRPVSGAMVRLEAASGPTGRRWLTGADGRYRIELPGPGTWWLRVERIGFAGERVGPLDVGGTDVVRRDLSVRAVPVRLRGLEVEGLGRCAPDPTRDGRLQVVWDEARKALDAARWTEEAGGLRFRLARRVRSLDTDGATVLTEREEVHDAFGSNSVRTLLPEDLARGGYVREREGLLYYYGPDAAVLLSDAFLRTHCFTLTRPEGGPADRIGLVFEPMEDRDTTDIRGVVWLDGPSGRLEEVEFSYTGMRPVPGREFARGRVTFLELADGRWVVRDWYIQAPVHSLEEVVGAGGRMGERLRLDAVQEYGSSVVSLTGEGGVRWPPGAVPDSVGRGR